MRIAQEEVFGPVAPIIVADNEAVTYYLRFIDELYHMIEDRFDSEKEKKEDKEVRKD
jgi:acyl-CoA reductase-like NAD-dependent aldehyde dehydrogenase